MAGIISGPHEMPMIHEQVTESRTSARKGPEHLQDHLAVADRPLPANGEISHFE